jgi:hypothetical protein
LYVFAFSGNPGTAVLDGGGSTPVGRVVTVGGMFVLPTAFDEAGVAADKGL